MKKFLCVLLTVILAVSMTVGVGASVITSDTGPGSAVPPVVTTGIRGINDGDIYDLVTGDITVNGKKNIISSLDDLSDLEVAPGDVIRIPLPGSLFTDADGNVFKSEKVALSALNAGRITIRTSFSRGAGSYIASLTGNRNGAFLEIEFTEGIFLKAQSFKSAIYFLARGSRVASTRIDIGGVLETPTIDMEWGDDYADLSDGSAIYARTSIRDAELYLGDYCTVTRNLARGVKYAGTATTDDINEQDVAVLQKHPSIQYIYKLKTVGLKTVGNIVTFDLGQRYYVYDANGIYIGTSDKALPYWTKYYLSTKKYESIKVK